MASGSMVLVEHVSELRSALEPARQNGARIGFVPTMGALHKGHESLLRIARDECDFVVASIFINPIQFGSASDLERYPRPVEADLEMCRASGVDVVFHPEAATMYPHPFNTIVEVTGLSDILEGGSRPGHFRGVTTVVLKLLNMAWPHRAYFGQKDFQQQLIVRRMCKELNHPSEIVVCPTIREADGLALSSRNVFLSDEERRSATALYQSLQKAQQLLKEGTSLLEIRQAMSETLQNRPHLVPDYATIVDSHSLVEMDTPTAEMTAIVAAVVGKTRLIDNMPLSLK